MRLSSAATWSRNYASFDEMTHGSRKEASASAHETLCASRGGHIEAITRSVLSHPLSYDPLEEHTVRYVLQRAIFGAKGNRGVAEAFDDARNSIH
jgi:hypothetical protein